MTDTGCMDKPTILVVDDSPDDLALISELLKSLYKVRIANNGERALKVALAGTPPDLILLDIMMPEINGFEVCEQMKANETLKDIPVIFISSLTETEEKVKAFSVGGVDYVTKPFQFAEVQARVDVHLELRRRKRELEQSYNKLRELERLRDSLVHMIVHDMRSPLSVVISYLELAKTETLQKEAADWISRAMSSAETLLAMISTLLDISKMEAGQMTLEVSTVDLQELASETIRMVEALKGQRCLTVTAPEKMEAFACDADLIRRVLQNLMGNALKFTNKETGSIAVHIEVAAENRVRVSVLDNGPGIPPEYHEKVFDKFSQVAARQQGHVYSTGLGLTFCKLAIEAHGGRIGVESEVGKGSTFWFELPRR